MPNSSILVDFRIQRGRLLSPLSSDIIHIRLLREQLATHTCPLSESSTSQIDELLAELPKELQLK
jgi:hypothetical protein